MLFLLATSATNVWVLYRLTSGGREVEPGQPGPPPGPARDLAEWQQLATSQAALHATRTARLRKVTATESVLYRSEFHCTAAAAGGDAEDRGGGGEARHGAAGAGRLGAAGLGRGRTAGEGGS